MMPKFKEIKGTIIDLFSKIYLDIAKPQQFGKTISRNRENLAKLELAPAKARKKQQHLSN